MPLDQNFKPVLRFMVVSDIHYKDEHSVERDRFRNAIQYAYEIAESSETYKKLDAVYIVGDFADNGSEIQMKAIKATLDENLRPGTATGLTLASHEYSQKNGGEEAARERFTQIFGLPHDFHDVINGFHFIGVTTTRGCHFDDPQKAFARTELAKAAADGARKPIFFFQHPHITDTVYGSINWGEDDLTAILMDYPQIIDFSGHSHAPINDPRSIHQKHFTSLGTGTLSYFELDEFDKIYGTIPEDEHDAAQMLIVEADAENRVRVYPYDVLTKRCFPQTWRIDVPSEPREFLYTDSRYKTADAPVFAADAKISVTDITEDGAVISFPQAAPAACDDYVNSYDIILREAATGIIKKQLSFWSKYYLYDMPPALSRWIRGLRGGTEYAVEVYANSFWKTCSAAPLRVSFRTV